MDPSADPRRANPTALRRREAGRSRRVEHRARACELTDWADAGYLDTLAAACAELGEFEAAAAWAEKAIAMASPADSVAYRGRLDLYRAGRAYRSGEPPV